MSEMSELLGRLSEAGLPLSEGIRDAMLSVDVMEFTDEDPQPFWRDRPLVFLRTEKGGIKTISAPHMVVTMLGHLETLPGQDVLLLGAKGGYLAALVAHLVGEEGSVTVVDPNRLVVDHVRGHLARRPELDLVKVRKLASIDRAPPHLPSPLQRVLVTGALSDVPHWIDARLDDGGFVIAPLGNRYGQRLVKRERQGESRYDTDLGGVIFGPVDVAESEERAPSTIELAEMLEEGAAIAEEIGALQAEDRGRLLDLAAAIRDLPDDLPDLGHYSDGDEGVHVFEIPMSAEDTDVGPIHPLLDLLWSEMHWLGPVLAVFDSLLDLRMQHPGDPEQPTARFEEGGFGSHGDLVP